jgi:hypothetical protein
MRLLVWLAWTATMTGCASRNAPLNSRPAAALFEAAYIDLQPGWRLRVVTPVLKSGGYRLLTGPSEVSGDTITLSATDFIGYETAYYAVKARKREGVRIEFNSAEVTKEGRTTPQSRPLVLLFQLPLSARYVRLIYLTRVSEADHDMAVVAAKQMDALNALTERVQANPGTACKTEGHLFCSWISGGIAVRPERREPAGGAGDWVPAR